jgi:hypothetical protein
MRLTIGMGMLTGQEIALMNVMQVESITVDEDMIQGLSSGKTYRPTGTGRLEGASELRIGSSLARLFIHITSQFLKISTKLFPLANYSIILQLSSTSIIITR